jgi:hypothetical protein
MKYYFELSTTIPEIFGGDDADYMLGLSNTERGYKDDGFDHDIGIHSSGVASVIRKLGIKDREMENIFFGKFTPELPDLETIQKLLEANDWGEYQGPSFVPSPSSDDFEFECEEEEDGFNYDFEEEEEEDEYADDYSDEYDEE